MDGAFPGSGILPGYKSQNKQISREAVEQHGCKNDKAYIIVDLSDLAGFDQPGNCGLQ